MNATVFANKNKIEKMNCNTVPTIISDFLPCLSDSFPLMIEPEKIPK